MILCQLRVATGFADLRVTLLLAPPQTQRLRSSIFHISQHPAFVDTKEAQKLLNYDYPEY